MNSAAHDVERIPTPIDSDEQNFVNGGILMKGDALLRQFGVEIANAQSRIPVLSPMIPGMLAETGASPTPHERQRSS